jgi:hypothetical protein
MKTKSEKPMPSAEMKTAVNSENESTAQRWDGNFSFEPERDFSGNLLVTLLRAFVRGREDYKEPSRTMRSLNLTPIKLSCYVLNMAARNLIEIDTDLGEEDNSGMYRVTKLGIEMVQALDGYEFFIP